MVQLAVRGSDDKLFDMLRRRAARRGPSVEAEHRAILEPAREPEMPSFADMAAQLRARTPPQFDNSADIIRQDRDRDHGDASR